MYLVVKILVSCIIVLASRTYLKINNWLGFSLSNTVYILADGIVVRF